MLYFESGSATITAADGLLLDRAARLFRDGQHPAFVISGAADRVGTPEANIEISRQRAASVLQALHARGISVEESQLVALGAAVQAVPTGDGVDEPRNRRVEIRWR